MPTTTTRVRMPANNRVHSRATLQTHDIWQSAIGYNLYAPNKEDDKNGCLALARITGSNVVEAHGACKRCDRVGHLMDHVNIFSQRGIQIYKLIKKKKESDDDSSKTNYEKRKKRGRSKKRSSRKREKHRKKDESSDEKSECRRRHMKSRMEKRRKKSHRYSDDSASESEDPTGIARDQHHHQ
ncbi:hypothetical protein UlMin_013443 [Ulmus minor]